MKVIGTNNKASYNYYIEDRFEAGIVLKGWEVKSVRKGKVQIDNSHITIKNNEAWIINLIINPIVSSNQSTSQSVRTRKLLLNRNEIKKLIGKVTQKNYTIIPTNIFLKNNYIKINIGTAKGKKVYDKRHSIKEREWQIKKEKLIKFTNK